MNHPKYNPITTCAVFTAWVLNTILRKNVSAPTVENALRAIPGNIRQRASNTYCVIRQRLGNARRAITSAPGKARKRVQLWVSDAMLDAGSKLIVLSDSAAALIAASGARLIAWSNALYPEPLTLTLPCPTTADGNLGCVPCLPQAAPVVILQEPALTLTWEEQEAAAEPLFKTFNQNVQNELQAALEAQPTVTPTVTVNERQEANTTLPTADLFAIPHEQRKRKGKDGKVRTDYKAVHPSKVTPGAPYWYKVGRKWVQQAALDHAAPVEETAVA